MLYHSEVEQQQRDLEKVEVAHDVSFEVEVGELKSDLAAARDAYSPETLGAVSVRQRVVGRDETARQATQFAAAACTATTRRFAHSFRCRARYVAVPNNSQYEICAAGGNY